MKSRKQILQKLRLFYGDVSHKRKSKRMRLQVDNEFQQLKIKDLKDENNVEMFTSCVRGGKAFVAEQKIKELKTRIAIIQNSTLNMNLVKSSKYGLSPEEIERHALSGERFKTIFNMHRIEKTQKLHRRLDDYDAKKYSAKRRKLRDELFISEKVYIVAE